MKDIIVLTKEQAQEWLNRPEHEGIKLLRCFGTDNLAAWQGDGQVYLNSCPFAVDYVGTLTRKKLWHWPKPDENTPIDAMCKCKSHDNPWCNRYWAGNGKCFDDGCTSWSNIGEPSKWPYIVLANPDDLDEMPPMDLEV